MYIRKHNLLFVHIPKTGGISINNTMKKVDKLELADVHRTASQLKKLIGVALYDQLFKFSIVRNPWDLMVSTYFYRKRMRDGTFCPPDKYNLEFSDWIKYIYSQEYAKLRLSSHNLDCVKYHFGNQLSWLTDDNGNIIVDKIIKLENLSDEVTEIFQDHGISLKLPHLNTSNHNHYSEYYDEESKKLIADHFSKDIQMFGFTFD